MNGTYSLVALIGILAVLVFYYHSANIKKLYEDIIASPKGWKRVEIVEEKSALEMFSEEVPCGAVEILSGAAACIVCFLMGWRLRHIHNYEKCAECLKKQNVIEEKVKNLQDKIDDFHKRYSLLTTELIYSNIIDEKELPLTKDAFQQMDTEGIDRSSQTIELTTLPPSPPDFKLQEQESEAGGCLRSLETDCDSGVIEVKSNHTFCVASDIFHDDPSVVMISEETISENELCSERYSETHSPTTSIAQEQKTHVDISNNHIAKTETYEREMIYPAEIDVVPCPSSYGGRESDGLESEQDRSCMINKDTRQNLTVLDVVEPVSLPIGSGECEALRSSKTANVNKGRIPQYQRLRKGSDQKQKSFREPEVVEVGRVFTPVHLSKETEHFAVDGTKSRNTTPRVYSLTSSEAVEHIPASSRRRKQRNYNAK